MSDTPRLVIATNNRGKLREFRELLAGCGFELVTPSDVGVAFDVEETGSSYEENARLKAVAAMEATGLPALADDSGLEIDHLDGRPGIYSARYAGGDRIDENISEAEQLRIVLDEMTNVPDERRGARFRAVICVGAPGTEIRCVEGVFEGRIAHEQRGANGFGYDPIFFVPELGMTSAELPSNVKNNLSHRGQAARRALPILKELSARVAR
jgi:XTP/dITP diphosphohydrolase